ncbi:RecQ family ATP-dependent DNA helicase [Bacillus salitolerans]|uniref:ATP-dependent DNA helicase RecQ n=1 Tax=Bacillus salitolerans TaxID=1437434 RepID=A0ABW4LVH8_9BACI
MKLHDILQEKFGYSSFRTGQEEIIGDVLSGQNVLALLPTGAGKSLCYLLPGYMSTGTTIIVSPLLSLMEDQVQQLQLIGEKRAVAINSFLRFEERQKVLNNLNQYRFIYVSPEMLQNKYFINRLKQLTISLFVIDEAHCISQWGHEFRTDYLKLHEVLQDLDHPTCLALTATATEQVLQDIVFALKLTDISFHIHSIDRQNISIKVEELASNDDKKEKLIQLVKKLQGPGMIYFSSRKWAEHICTLLQSAGVEGVAFYHGGMDNEQRLLIQQQFISDQLQLICCTNAFGMGVNKPNVRYVIHFHYPGQIESYLQEIGRAGRDGDKSTAILLYSPDDDDLPEILMMQEFPSVDELDHILTIINEQIVPGKEINEEWLLTQSTITETGWRYIKYHLEDNGWIFNNRVLKQLNKKDITTHIMNMTHKRIQYKQLKLHEMRSWIKSKTCRRRTYLSLFNEKQTTTVYPCCDICGYEEEIYVKQSDKNSENNHYLNWQHELKMILLKESGVHEKSVRNN